MPISTVKGAEVQVQTYRLLPLSVAFHMDRPSPPFLPVIYYSVKLREKKK